MAYLQYAGGNQVYGLAGLAGAQEASGVNDHPPNRVRDCSCLLCTLWKLACSSAANPGVAKAVLTVTTAHPHLAAQNDFDTPYTGSYFLTADGDLEVSQPVYLFVDLEAAFQVSWERSSSGFGVVSAQMRHLRGHVSCLAQLIMRCSPALS